MTDIRLQLVIKLISLGKMHVALTWVITACIGHRRWRVYDAFDPRDDVSVYACDASPQDALLH